MYIGHCKEFLKLRFEVLAPCKSKFVRLSCFFQGRNTDHLQGSDMAYVSQNFGTEEGHQSQ